MNTNNINQIFKKVLKNLSFVSLGLGVFNTINNQTTIKKLKEDLDVERKISFDLTSQVNNLINKESFNQNIEINNKLDKINDKINKIIEFRIFFLKKDLLIIIIVLIALLILNIMFFITFIL